MKKFVQRDTVEFQFSLNQPFHSIDDFINFTFVLEDLKEEIFWNVMNNVSRQTIIYS